MGPASPSHRSSGVPTSVITAATPSPAGNHVSESEPERATPAAPDAIASKRDKKKKKEEKKRRRAAEDGTPLKKKKRDKAQDADAPGTKTKAPGGTPSPPPTRRVTPGAAHRRHSSCRIDHQ